MTTHPAIQLIERRVSADHFDAGHALRHDEIEELIRLATRAPTAYNFQNWRFIAASTAQTKARLRDLAHGQAKVSDAAVTFIVCGLRPDARDLAARLHPFVQAGHMPADMARDWQTAALAQYADAQAARDEAVRSASLGAATLMHAAEAMGYVSCPMVGFDAEGVVRAFALAPQEIPVMLVAVGRAAPGNWPQKPRRPLAEVLEIA